MIGYAIDLVRITQERWNVVSTAGRVRALIDRFQPILLHSQADYDQHERELDFVLQAEPRFAGPEIRYSGRQPVLGFFGDPHSKVPWLLPYLAEHRIDYVACPYDSVFFAQFPSFPRSRFFRFWWSVAAESISDQPPAVRSEEVAIWGETRHEAYALRRWCAARPRVSVYPREIAGPNPTVPAYFERLRRFDAAVVAMSEDPRYSYPVAKVVEVLASGSLLFTQDMPDLAYLGIDESNCVPFTRDDFDAKVAHYLAHREAYLGIRNRGLDLARSRHRNDCRLDELAAFIESHIR